MEEFKSNNREQTHQIATPTLSSGLLEPTSLPGWISTRAQAQSHTRYVYKGLSEALADISKDSPPFYQMVEPKIKNQKFVLFPTIEKPSAPMSDQINTQFTSERTIDRTINLARNTKFLPARHICFGYPPFFPETIEEGTLMSLAASQIQHWPIYQHDTRKPGFCFQLRDIQVIEGDYHYIKLYTTTQKHSGLPRIIYFIVQVTPYDLWELLQNPMWRKSLVTNGIPSQRYMFTVNTRLHMPFFYGLEDSHDAWNLILNISHALYCTLTCRFVYTDYRIIVRRLPELMFWNDAALAEFQSVYCFFKPKYLCLDEETFEKAYKRKWDYEWNCFFKPSVMWWEKRYKKFVKSRSNALDFQGGIVSRPEFEMVNSDPGLLQSVREIGKVAQSVNSAKIQFDNFCNTHVISQLISFVDAVQQMFSDTVYNIDSIMDSPAAFFNKLVSDVSLSFGPKTPTATDFMTILGSLFGGVYMYTNQRIIGGALILYGSWSLGTIIFTDAKVQRTFAKIIFFTFIVLLEATKSTQASLVLQAENSLLTNICVGSATALALVFGASNKAFSFSSLFSYLSTNTKDLFNVTRGFPSLIRTLELIVTMFKDGLTYMFGESAIYGSLVKCTVSDVELQHYIVYAMSTTAEDISTFTLDMEARGKWEDMCKLHKHFIEIFASKEPPTPGHIGFSMYKTAMTKFLELKREYNKVKDSINFYRPEPFMIWVWGEPGTGKTFGRDLLVKNLYHWHTTIDPTYDCVSTGLLYVRNPADPFMSGYNGHFAVAYDDVGANRQATNGEFNELMGMASTNQVRMHMPELADKGRCFSSKIVLMASNTRDVNSNNLLLSEKAFNRRRHIILQVERPDKTTTDLATSRKDFSLVRITVTDPQTDSVLKIFPAEGFGANDEMWKEFHTWLAPKYEKHVKTQEALLRRKDEELKALLTDQKHESVIDLKTVTPTPTGPTEISPDLIDICTPASVLFENKSIKESVLDTMKLKLFSTISDELLGIRIASNMSTEIGDALRHWRETPCELTELCVIDAVREHLDIDINQTHLDRLKGVKIEITEEQKKSLLELFKEKITEKSQQFPWVKALSVVGVLGSAFGLYRAYKSDEKKQPQFQSYDQPILNPPGKQVVFQSYDTPILNPPSKQVVFQSTTEDLLELFKSNTYRAYRLLGENHASVHCIAIQYNTFLFPFHFLSTNELAYQLCHPKRGNFFVNIGPTDIKRIGNTDWALVNLPTLPHHKSIIHHFASENQLLKIQVFNSMMLSLTPVKNTLEFNRGSMGTARRWDTPFVKEANGQQVYICSGYKYKYETKNGDCGSLVLAMDNTCGSKIMGMHFGYVISESTGYCSLIPREHLEKAIQTITPNEQKIDPGKMDWQFAIGDAPPVIHKEGELPSFEYFGIVNNAPSQPLTHGPLQRSPAYAQIYEPTKDLSVLRKNDARLDEKHQGDPDILERNVLDFDLDTAPWPNAELTMATEFLQHELENLQESIPRTVQDLEWAINGTWIEDARLPNTEPINLHTSSGYGLSGVKFDHFDTTNPKEIRIKNPRLQQMVDEQWNDWMDGKTHPCLWTHALKSEALKFSKIKTGATRTFCVAQTAFLLNVRRLFGSFTVAMKNSKISSFSCLGMDPRSAQWTDLFNNLREVSDIGCDMDFFKYDRTAVTAQLALAVAQAVNSWYNDDSKHQRARIIVINDLIHSYCLIKQYLTRKKRGNPSGNPLTTELNNCVNLLMLCMVYMIVARKKQPDQMTLKSFKENVRAKFFGDDVIFALSRTASEWLTPIDLSDVYKEFGVPVTPADKTNELTYRPLEQLSFLKRSFVKFDDPRYPWQAALDQDSIRNLTQFIRVEKHQGLPIDSIKANFEDSLIEAYHWGQEFFEDHKRKLNTWLKENNYPTVITTFMECDSAYRLKLGLIQGSQSPSSKFEGQIICKLREAFLRESANSVSGVATR